MSDAINRMRARQAEDGYGPHLYGDGPNVGDFVPYLNLISQAAGGAKGGSSSDAAKAQAAAQAAALKKADDQAKLYRNITLGLLGIGTAGVLWAVMR